MVTDGRTGRRADGQEDGRTGRRADGRWFRLASAGIGFGVATLAVVSAHATPPVGPSARPPLQAAPAVIINDLDGKPVNLGAYLGKKVVYLQFWATWCELCEALDPQVRVAKAKYGSDVEFLGINVTVNQRLERVKRHVAEAKPPYLALWDDKGVAVRAYDVPSTSYVVIVDKTGKIAYTGVGKDQDLAGALRKVVGR
jgi:thiol-disulfide isomerase/thioredoxin